MSTPTVIQLCDSPFVGGPGKQILGQCRRADGAHFDLVIVSFARRGSQSTPLTAAAKELGLQTEAVKDGKLAFPTAVRQLRDAVYRRQASLLVSHGFKADFCAAVVSAITGVPFVSYFHGRTGVSLKVRLYEALDVHAMRRARAVVAVCGRSAEQLRGHGLDNVVVIPNAIDAAAAATDGSRSIARAELRLNARDPVVGTVGRLSVEKGHSHLVDAAPAVLERFPSCRFVLIGSGLELNGLSRRARALGVRDRFDFIGHRPDAVALMKAFDVFVLPSLTENLPVSLLEAMACGLGVVATDVGGVREVLAPTGVEPVTPGSAEAISEAVSALLADPDLRSRHATALARRARDFSFDRQAVLFENLLRCSIGSHHPERRLSRAIL